MHLLKFSELKNTCGWGSNSQTTCSSHTGNPAPGCVSGEGCGAMGMSQDTVRNSSCWGWGSCSHGAQWSSVRHSCPGTDLCFSFTPSSSKIILKKKVMCVCAKAFPVRRPVWGWSHSSLDSADIVTSHSQPFPDPQHHHLGTGQRKAWTPELLPLFQASQAACPSSQPMTGSLWCSPFCWDPPWALPCPFAFLVSPLSSESSPLGSHPGAELMALAMLIKWDFPIRHREGTWHGRGLFSIKKQLEQMGRDRLWGKQRPWGIIPWVGVPVAPLQWPKGSLSHFSPHRAAVGLCRLEHKVKAQSTFIIKGLSESGSWLLILCKAQGLRQGSWAAGYSEKLGCKLQGLSGILETLLSLEGFKKSWSALSQNLWSKKYFELAFACFKFEPPLLVLIQILSNKECCFFSL